MPVGDLVCIIVPFSNYVTTACNQYFRPYKISVNIQRIFKEYSCLFQDVNGTEGYCVCSKDNLANINRIILVDIFFFFFWLCDLLDSEEEISIILIELTFRFIKSKTLYQQSKISDTLSNII